MFSLTISALATENGRRIGKPFVQNKNTKINIVLRRRCVVRNFLPTTDFPDCFFPLILFPFLYIYSRSGFFPTFRKFLCNTNQVEISRWASEKASTVFFITVLLNVLCFNAFTNSKQMKKKMHNSIVSWHSKFLRFNEYVMSSSLFGSTKFKLYQKIATTVRGLNVIYFYTNAHKPQLSRSLLSLKECKHLLLMTILRFFLMIKWRTQKHCARSTLRYDKNKHEMRIPLKRNKYVIRFDSNEQQTKNWINISVKYEWIWFFYHFKRFKFKVTIPAINIDEYWMTHFQHAICSPNEFFFSYPKWVFFLLIQNIYFYTCARLTVSSSMLYCLLNLKL